MIMTKKKREQQQVDKFKAYCAGVNVESLRTARQSLRRMERLTPHRAAGVKIILTMLDLLYDEMSREAVDEEYDLPF